MAKKAKKKAAKKTATRGKKSMETVIVGSKVKAAIKESGCMTSGELLEALNVAVHNMIAEACQRATNNKRSTVRAHDL